MSNLYPLNQAVVAQALHALHNDQLRKAKSMGFEDQDLDALKQPIVASMLVNAKVPWCSVRVNREVLRRLLEQAAQVSGEIDVIDRLLRLGASSEIMSRFYGLTHQETALRRIVVGLSKCKGRPRVLSAEQDAELWSRWSETVKTRGAALTLDSVMLAIAADLAEAMDISLSVIWHAIGKWIDEGLV